MIRKLSLLVLVLFSFSACQKSSRTSVPVLKLSPRPTAASAALLALRLHLPAEAAYELTAADLKAAGYPVEQLSPANFRLFWRGQPQPLQVESAGEDFRLRFWGRSGDSAYTPETIYILRYDDSLPAASIPTVELPAVGAPSDIYTATVHAEQNQLYAPQPAEGDHWFWQAVPAKKSQAFEIHLAQPVSGAAHLRLALWSGTEAQQSPDHHLTVKLNGAPLLDVTWDGAGRQLFEALIPAGVLLDGKNTLEATLPGDTGVVAERTYINWWEIRYPRRAAAQNDALALEGNGAAVKAEGFGGAVTIWDVTVPTSTLRIASDSASFQTQGGHRYWLAGPQGFAKPARLEPLVELPDLSGALYLAVGAADLLPPLQPMLQEHSAHGLPAVAVPLQAVYDQFGAGYPEPEAIHRLLAQVKPQYALLVGDYTYDPYGYTVPPEANRLPGYFIQTTFGGQTISDLPYAQINEDPWPDLALGRLPARTPAEVTVWARKTLAYAQQTDLAWRTRVLAIADGQEASFGSDAQIFLDQFSPAFSTGLYSPAAGVTDANAKVIDYFAAGYGIIGYFGHGSINMWGKDRIFNTEDAAKLTNGAHLPVVINMNCLTGLFTHPKVASLAETLLWQEAGGASLVMAPTSLTLPNDQALLSGAFAEALSADPQASLGQAFLAAQRKIPLEQPGANEVLMTFLLFGDPALALTR